jgi:hypothetical protein
MAVAGDQEAFRGQPVNQGEALLAEITDGDLLHE